MTVELPKRAEDIFYDLIEVPETARAAAVEEACAGDDRLRLEVLSLLASHRQAGEFMDTERARDAANVLDAAPLQPGARVADYTVLGVLGVGGMGVVYLAEQDRPRRTVALKLIRRSVVSDGLVRRFEHEAEVLGRLQHPGIAQIFEAGAATIDGPTPTPFIAMELVTGRALTRHAKDKNLSTRQRLALMAAICDAVQHAHQRGIIHRDLKPGNILIDDAGRPKILDFGVARAVGTDIHTATLRTSVGQLIGTLRYMSPEQVRADPGEIDTRSDIYALGVMLFELLAGRAPHNLESTALPEIARVICEEPAPRLASIDRALRGDVDTIAAKALEKDKARRYQSAAELADDIRRYLDGRPIAARDDSALYVLRKRLRRYRGTLGLAGASIVGLAALSVFAFRESGRNEKLAKSDAAAKTEALAALKAAKDARSIADITATRLRNELATTTIERGRLLAHAGNLGGAEDLLWPEHLKNPDSRQSLWALRELYKHEPLLATVKAHEGKVWGLALTSDSKTLYSGGEEGQVRRWDLSKLRPVADIGPPGAAIFDLVISPDQKIIAIARTDGTITLCNLVTGTLRPPILAHPNGSTKSVAFSPDSLVLAACGNEHSSEDKPDKPDEKIGRIHLFDVASGQLLQTFATEFRSAMQHIAWSPDGYAIAAASGFPESRVCLFEARTGRATELPGHGGGVGHVEFSPDGTMLATGASDRDIRLWNVATHQLVARLSAPNGTIRALHFTSDGQKLVSSGWWTTDLWDIAQRRRIRSISLRESGFETKLSADGRLLVSSFGDGTIRFWDLTPDAGLTRLADHSGRCYGDLSPDGRLAATGDSEGVLRIWETRTGALLARFKCHVGHIKCVKFSPDGRTLASGADDGRCRLWDLRTGTLLATLTGFDAVSDDSLCFSPDGQFIAVPRVDSSVSVCRTPGLIEDQSLAPVNFEVISTKYSPDGETLAVIARDRIVRLYPTAGGPAIQLMPSPVVAPWVCGFSPDGSTLAVGDWAKSVELWELASGVEYGRLQGHSGLIDAVAYMPGDPRTIVSAAADGAVRLWDAQTGFCLVTLEAFDGWDALCLAISRDGRRVFATGASGEAVIWELPYFDRHIAGNADYQIGQFKSTLGSELQEDRIRAWADSVMNAPRTLEPEAPDVPGTDPLTIQSWGVIR